MNALAAGALGASCVLAGVACGSSGSPAGSTVPPVTLAPTPAPTPPTTGGEVEASSCLLGAGTVDTSCSRRGSTHLPDVQGAIDRVVQARPELFDLEDESVAGTAQYRVRDREAYLEAVVVELRSAGFCAQRDFEGNLIQVKDSNDLSEDFEVYRSDYIQRGAYLASCQPAAFPVQPADIIEAVRVAFWALDCDPGIVAPPNLARQLPLRCDGWVTATPKDRESRDVPMAVHGPDIDWELRRGDAVVEVLADPLYQNPFNRVLRARGPMGPFQLCATVQGIEGCLSGETIP